MDMLKYIPGFEKFWARKTGKQVSARFASVAAELQAMGDVFTEKGRADAAEEMPPRFDIVHVMITGAVPNDSSPLSRLMKMCYDEGYSCQKHS